MQVSRRGLVIAGGVGAAAVMLAPGPAHARRLSVRTGRINQAALAAIEADACPGLQVAIAHAGDIVFSRGYGIANLETRAPVNSRSVFRIASLTKQFTAAAIIKLAATGALELDAPVQRYLPFMRALPEATLLELMHHTAGLHENEAVLPLHAGAAETQIALAEEIARQSEVFDFAPGTAWRYSNANYIVLGAVIEAVSGNSLGEAMAELVFTPLGLGATAFDHASDIVANRASGYSATGNVGAPFQNAPLLEVSDAGGAGAMRSTASDLCRWHEALLSGRLFGQSYIDLMVAPGRLRDGRLSGANRFLPEDAQYGDTQYAGGLLVSPPSDPHRGLFHYGYINGFACMLQTFTGANVTLAVLCNGDVGPATPFRAIRQIVTETLG